MTSIELRDAWPGDSAFIFDVRRQAFSEYLEVAEGWNDALELERHSERFGRHYFRVIVADGSDVGYVATALHPADSQPSSLYLHQLMVLPPFQSRGIGASCFRRISDEARALGLPIRLRVLRVNPRALAFYLQAGCEVIGETESHINLELWS